MPSGCDYGPTTDSQPSLPIVNSPSLFSLAHALLVPSPSRSQGHHCPHPLRPVQQPHLDRRGEVCEGIVEVEGILEVIEGADEDDAAADVDTVDRWVGHGHSESKVD
jgi:hypothetical protein